MKFKKIYTIYISLAAIFVTTVNFSGITLAADKEYFLFDRMGDLLLVSKENDIFVRMLDGTGTKRITDSIDVLEKDAFFTKDGRYILYMVDKSRYFAGGVSDIKIFYYLQPIHKADTDSGKGGIEISEELYKDFKKERLADKYKRVVYLDLGLDSEKDTEGIKEAFVSETESNKEKKEEW